MKYEPTRRTERGGVERGRRLTCRQCVKNRKNARDLSQATASKKHLPMNEGLLRTRCRRQHPVVQAGYLSLRSSFQVKKLVISYLRLERHLFWLESMVNYTGPRTVLPMSQLMAFSPRDVIDPNVFLMTPFNGGGISKGYKLHHPRPRHP